MATGEDVVWVQLSTRIPKALHHRIKLRCIGGDISMTAFVTEAITEKLTLSKAPPAARVTSDKLHSDISGRKGAAVPGRN